jgi:SAM-dependent methyltransferase
MRNIDSWRPSKFVERDGRWICSSRHSDLGIGSRIYGSIEIETCQRAIRAHARGRLLDLGCGKAPLFGVYRPFVEDVICMDWPASLHGSEFIDYFVDLNGPLPLATGEIDTILLTSVLEHVAKPETLWQEISRVLRRGGKVIVTSPFLYPLHEEPHDYNRFTAHKLRQFCEEAGLSVIELEPSGGALEVILDIIAKHLHRHSLLARVHLALSGLLLRFKPLKAISDDTRRAFPLCYILVAEKPDYPTADGAG